MSKSPAAGFYGPGIFGGWLILVSSLIASWTLDPIERHKDDFTREVFMALAYPVIASGHAVYLFVDHKRHDKSPLDLGPADLAPATVVRTAQLLIAILTGITIYNRTPRRQVLVSSGINLIMVSNYILGTLRITYHHGPNQTIKTISITLDVLVLAMLFLDINKPPMFRRFLSYQVPMYALISGLVLSAITTATERQLNDPANLLNFIPQTSYSITEFNQAVSLSGGLLIFLGTSVQIGFRRYRQRRESKKQG